MRNRLTAFALFLLGLIGSLTLSLALAQDVVPRAPAIRPGAKPLHIRPAHYDPPADPAPKKPAHDLARLTPLQKQLYQAARRAARWLDRMNEVNGRFDDALQPALNVRVPGEHPLRQAGAAVALARAAHFFNDDGQAAHARQAVLALLENTVADSDKKARHFILPSAIVNRLSHAALLVLAIHELPKPNEELLSKSDQLCEYLRRQQRADGSLRCREAVAGGQEEDEAAEVQQYPGQALYALMRSQEHRPAAWKTAIIRKATPFYLKWWREHKSREFTTWHTAAWAEAFQATREKPFADAVFEVNDWLCGLQHEGLDPQHPQWLGGFRTVAEGKVVAEAPDALSGLATASLAEACRVTRRQGDLHRHEKYNAALERGFQFLTTLQYTDADTQHFADWYRPRLQGGFHLNHQDGNLRIDYTQHALTGLVQYLRQVTSAP